MYINPFIKYITNSTHRIYRTERGLRRLIPTTINYIPLLAAKFLVYSLCELYMVPALATFNKNTCY